jgi:DNA-binding transcriptional LysR family regulator
MSWGTLNLPAALEEFRGCNPLVTVQLRQSVTGSAGHLSAIADGRMDLALVSSTSPGSPLVRLHELMREPMVFVCESSHPLADRRQVALADLAGHDLIQFPAGWGIRQRLDKGLRHCRRRARQRLRSGRLCDHRRAHPAPFGRDRYAGQRRQPFSRPADSCAAAGDDVDAVYRVGGVAERTVRSTRWSTR